MTCPGCDRADGVEPTGPDAGRCTHCGMSWAVSIVNPRPLPGYLADLGAAAEEIGRLRWGLDKVIALADEAPQLSDQRLRERLLALAVVLRPGPSRENPR